VTKIQAFGVSSARSAAKHVRRTLDREQKKFHVPLLAATSESPPPITIAVVGPPKVGKTTLIQSLVKNYTKHSIVEVKGPITIVSGKQRRLTFYECPNDLNSMIDIAKVADLVLLLIDASFGFEMETFEFLNILQIHGFPKIIGVLTHLDLFKNQTKLKTTKKKLKQRFWTEIYQGAKLFYLSGLINDKYPKIEIRNLARFISVVKYRPLVWRSSHSHILVDRIEDLTDPDLIRNNSKADRKVSFYGYVRGTNLKRNQRIHIPGSGDYSMTDVTAIPDPCPFPTKVKKTLNEKERIIYAPMADLGNIFFDKDAIYINVPENMQSNRDSDDVQLVRSLQDTKETIDHMLSSSNVKIFKNSVSNDYDDEEEDDNDIDDDDLDESAFLDDGKYQRNISFPHEYF
jgi:ribosome biogenesis protein BMS1